MFLQYLLLSIIYEVKRVMEVNVVIVYLMYNMI